MDINVTGNDFTKKDVETIEGLRFKVVKTEDDVDKALNPDGNIDINIKAGLELAYFVATNSTPAMIVSLMLALEGITDGDKIMTSLLNPHSEFRLHFLTRCFENEKYNGGHTL